MGTLALTDPVNGTTADASLVANNNSATKTVINGGIDNTNINAGAAIAQSKLANGPGFELGYDQTTATITVASSTESASTTVIAGTAHAFDGGAVLAHFFSPEIDLPNAVGAQVIVCLFEASTQVGRLLVKQTGTAGANSTGEGNGYLRFTPTAATHTYTVSAFYTNTTGSVVRAGPGGTAANVPAFIRYTKV